MTFKKIILKEGAEGTTVKATDDLSGENGSVWKFMTRRNGEATAEAVSDSKFGENAKAVKISITMAGTEDYSVQFVQGNIPVCRECASSALEI